MRSRTAEDEAINRAARAILNRTQQQQQQDERHGETTSEQRGRRRRKEKDGEERTPPPLPVQPAAPNAAPTGAGRRPQSVKALPGRSISHGSPFPLSFFTAGRSAPARLGSGTGQRRGVVRGEEGGGVWIWAGRIRWRPSWRSSDSAFAAVEAQLGAGDLAGVGDGSARSRWSSP